MGFRRGRGSRLGEVRRSDWYWCRRGGFDAGVAVVVDVEEEEGRILRQAGGSRALLSALFAPVGNGAGMPGTPVGFSDRPPAVIAAVDCSSSSRRGCFHNLRRSRIARARLAPG